MNEATCESIRPLLFAALEGQLDRDERVRVHAHLAVCERCCAAERSERALTALLDPTAVAHSRPRRARVWARRISSPE